MRSLANLLFATLVFSAASSATASVGGYWTAENSDLVKKEMKISGQTCGLSDQSSDAQWISCYDISHALHFGAVPRIQSLISIVQTKVLNWGFVVHDAQGEQIYRQYSESLPQLCRDLGRATENIGALIKYVYPELIEGPPMKHQKYVDLVNAHIDLDNAIFNACGVGSLDMIAGLETAHAPLRMKLQAVASGTYILKVP